MAQAVTGLAGTRPSPDGQARAKIPPLPRHRRRSLLALGSALICLGALTAAWLFTAASHRVAVLVATRDIPLGTVITSADLAATDISAGAGVASIPARQESQVTGRVAAVDVRAHTLLAASDVTTALLPARGQVLVPVALKAWQLPASGLTPGDAVLVIPTPGVAGQAVAGAGGSAMTAAVPAVVFQVSAPDQSGNVTADLLLAAPAGPAVARQASTGQIALIVTARGP